MSDLRIFSYLPNPRVWKATIAARLGGVSLDIRGAKPGELQGWLWDVDPRPLTEAERQAPQATERQARAGFSGSLQKTDAFMAANPFGTVPVAFSPDGKTGVFESNAIMRAVARLAGDRFPLYGNDAYEAARVESFLDVSLIFARDSQTYLLSVANRTLTAEVQESARAAFETYLTGMEQALQPDRRFFVGDDVTLADICFVCELTLFSRERASVPSRYPEVFTSIVDDAVRSRFPLAFAHYERLCGHPAFELDVGPYRAKLEQDIARITAA